MNRNIQRGLTLVELIVVIAIIGMLASVALPTYQDYMIRTHITEGLGIAEPLKREITLNSTTLGDLNAAINSWNGQAGGLGAVSKYVSSVTATAGTGVITVTYNVANVGTIGAAANTLVFSPYIQNGIAAQSLGAALAASVSGMVDWACASATNTTATRQGLTGAPLGSVPAKYAPSQCR